MQCIYCEERHWLRCNGPRWPGWLYEQFERSLVAFECSKCGKAHSAWLDRAHASLCIPEWKPLSCLNVLPDRVWNSLKVMDFGRLDDPPTLSESGLAAQWAEALDQCGPQEDEPHEMSPEETAVMLRASGLYHEVAITMALEKLQTLREARRGQSLVDIPRPHVELIWLGGGAPRSASSFSTASSTK